MLTVSCCRFFLLFFAVLSDEEKHVQGIVFVCWFQLSLLESFFILAGFGGNGFYSIILLFCFLGYFLPFWGIFLVCHCSIFCTCPGVLFRNCLFAFFV